MVVKNVTYSNGRCIVSLVDSNFEISFPITDDPGIMPRDEIIMTNSMIWKIVRYERPCHISDCYLCDDDIDDLPFPEVF